MATKLNAEQLVQARQFWYECGRNLAKTGAKFRVAKGTIKRYRKVFEWDKWASAVDEKAAEEGLLTVSARRAKILKLGDDYLGRLEPHVKHGQIKAQSVGGELQKVAQTSELLTGGATDRLSVEGLASLFDSASPEKQQEFIDALRRRAKSSG